MSINNIVVKRLELIGAPLSRCGAERAQVMAEYALLLALAAVTAIGVIAAFGAEISISSTAIATHIFCAG